MLWALIRYNSITDKETDDSWDIYIIIWAEEKFQKKFQKKKKKFNDLIPTIPKGRAKPPGGGWSASIYNIKNQFWVCLGSQASTAKKNIGGWLWATFEARFLCFHGQKISLIFFWKYCSVRTEKLHRIKVKKSF